MTLPPRVPFSEPDLTEGELPFHSSTEGYTIRDIVRLDEEMMVWSDSGPAAVIESFMPFITVVGVIMAVVSACGSVSVLMDSTTGIGDRLITASIAFALCAFCIAMAYVSWRFSFGSKSSDIYFLKKQRKIYCHRDKLELLLDWNNVRPNALLGSGPAQLGSPPFMALELVEHIKDVPGAWRARFVVDALLANRADCQRSWELIRCYMDDEPSAFPEQTVVDPHSWTSRLLEFGPLSDGGDAAGFIRTLREHNWQPFLTGENQLKALIWLLFWPDPVLQMLYARFRPKVALPQTLAMLVRTEATAESPYAIAALSEQEHRGRRKAALIVAAVCAICTLTSLTAWSLGTYFMLDDVYHWSK